jgi:hypothetical protein
VGISASGIQTMASFMQWVQAVESILLHVFNNPFVSLALTVFAIMYAAILAPELPPRVLKSFNSVWGRILFGFFIVFLATFNAPVALVMSVAFVLTMAYAQRSQIWATTMHQPGIPTTPPSTTQGYQTSWLPSANSSSASDAANVEGFQASSRSKTRENFIAMTDAERAAKLATVSTEEEMQEIQQQLDRVNKLRNAGHSVNGSALSNGSGFAGDSDGIF